MSEILNNGEGCTTGTTRRSFIRGMAIFAVGGILSSCGVTSQKVEKGGQKLAPLAEFSPEQKIKMKALASELKAAFDGKPQYDVSVGTKEGYFPDTARITLLEGKGTGNIYTINIELSRPSSLPFHMHASNGPERLAYVLGGDGNIVSPYTNGVRADMFSIEPIEGDGSSHPFIAMYLTEFPISKKDLSPLLSGGTMQVYLGDQPGSHIVTPNYTPYLPNGFVPVESFVVSGLSSVQVGNYVR